MGYTAQGNLYIVSYNESQMKEATTKKVSAPARSPRDEEKHKKQKHDKEEQ
jgi:hypothetical protein